MRARRRREWFLFPFKGRSSRSFCGWCEGYMCMQSLLHRLLCGLIVIFLAGTAFGQTRVISVVAGDGTAGYSGDGGPAVRARLHEPSEVAVDSAGNFFIAD